MEIKIKLDSINELINVYEGDESYYIDSIISNILQSEIIYYSRDYCFDDIYDSVDKNDICRNKKNCRTYYT